LFHHIIYVDSPDIELGHRREAYFPELCLGYEEHVQLQSSADHLKGISIEGAR